MRRFELSDGASNKFWEIEQKSSQVSVRFGRIGSRGSTKETAFESAAAAKTSVDKLVASKVKKGYREVSAKAPTRKATQPPARGASQDDLSGALAALMDSKSFADQLSRAAAPAILLSAGKPVKVGVEVPKDYVLLAVVHGSKELGLDPAHALALLQKRKPKRSGKLERTIAVPSGLEPTGNIAVCRIPKSACSELVLDVERSDSYPDEPLFYRAIVRGKAVVDCDEHALLHWIFEQRAMLEHVGSPKNRRVASAAASKRIAKALGSPSPKARAASRVGGAPVFNAAHERLPPGNYRYALHLGADLFDCFFGDAGSFHLWLADGAKKAFWMADSA